LFCTNIPPHLALLIPGTDPPAPTSRRCSPDGLVSPRADSPRSRFGIGSASYAPVVPPLREPLPTTTPIFGSGEPVAPFCLRIVNLPSRARIAPHRPRL